MAFMEFEWEPAPYIEAELGWESYFAPEYLADAPEGAETTRHETGGLWRLSAPGFLDCTDWTPAESEEAAREEAAELYGGDIR